MDGFFDQVYGLNRAGVAQSINVPISNRKVKSSMLIRLVYRAVMSLGKTLIADIPNKVAMQLSG